VKLFCFAHAVRVSHLNHDAYSLNFNCRLAAPHDESVDHAVFRLVSPSQDGQDLQVLTEHGLEADLQLLTLNLDS